MTQTIIVAIVVLAAVAWAVWSFMRSARGEGGCGSCGSAGSCPFADEDNCPSGTLDDTAATEGAPHVEEG